jgi:hypothetical protein
MDSGNRQESTTFSLLISESRALTRQELEAMSGDDEEDSDDFQFGFHTVASSKPKKKVGERT